MTNEEAKEEVIATLCELDWEDKKYVSEHLSRDALFSCLCSLEKQIPKKPDFEGDGYADGCLVYDTWICPCCGEKYEVDYEKYDHCPKCGQALDWSDTK